MNSLVLPVWGGYTLPMCRLSCACLHGPKRWHVGRLVLDAEILEYASNFVNQEARATAFTPAMAQAAVPCVLCARLQRIVFWLFMCLLQS
jgi:hypothetical protein